MPQKPMDSPGLETALDEDEKSHVDRIDDQLAAISDFFEGLTTGVSVMVSRLEPEWCSGYLEEIDIMEGREPIDINYLIKTWGGKRLRCRVRSRRGRSSGQWLRSIDIPLQTWDPLRRGKRIFPLTDDPEGDNGDTWTTKPPAPAPARSGLGELGELASLMGLLQKNQLEAMQALGLGARQPRGDNGGTTIATAIELAKLLSASSAPASSNEDSSIELFGRALDILRPQPPAPAPAIVSSQSSQPVRLADHLARLEPDQAVGCLQEALGKMPAERRNGAMAALLRALADTGILDGDGDTDDEADDDTDTGETAPGGDD
ncbi:MAG: hypothetical protein WC372_07260 [Candidatus Neomarinimicrobiota bacterium]|jgi:hypothetical protein